MWNGTMFVDLDWPLNASSLLSASAELLVFHRDHVRQAARLLIASIIDLQSVHVAPFTTKRKQDRTYYAPPPRRGH